MRVQEWRPSFLPSPTRDNQHLAQHLGDRVDLASKTVDLDLAKLEFDDAVTHLQSLRLHEIDL